MSSLGKDLAHIREQQGYTLEQIYDSTRIPLQTLKAIEDDSIFTDFNENKTYIRSFVRTYARKLSIDDALIIKALDQVETETYSGILSKVDAQHPENTPLSALEEHLPQEKSKPKKKKPSPPRKQEKKEEPAQPTTSSSAKEEEIRRQQKQRVEQPPDVQSVNWADIGQRFSQFEASTPVWIIGVIVVIIAGLLIYFIGFSGSNDNEPMASNQSQQEQPALLTDSLQMKMQQPLDTSASAEMVREEAPAEQGLPDTLRILIYAAYGNLEPVRVHSDLGTNFNPYWIENKEAMRFDFTDTLRIRGQYSRMLLLYHDRYIPDFRSRFYQPDSGYIELTRSLFENRDALFASVQDSLPANVSPPVAVNDHPVFR